jgi:aminocarboxymuconate-semialdehyde decarboxylase
MTRLQIVDFHSHYAGPGFELTTLVGVPPGGQALWTRVNGLLTDPVALVASVEESGIAARVVSMPLEFLADSDGHVSAEVIRRVNDTIAETVRRLPGRLYGLATVDAYAGEPAARELRRAVDELGLRGVFVESAKGDLLPDAAEARPTFAAAAELGVPVFLHPVPDRRLHARFGSYGRAGARLMRSTINSAALIAMVESGMLDELPRLRVVLTALAIGGVFIAGELRGRNVYIDTTGLHPVAVRSAVDLLGAGRVLMGTDWPVVLETPERIEAVLAAAGLDAADRRMIAGENTLELLGVA